MSWLVALYPSAWRSRFEDELLALLDSRPRSIRDRVDIVRSAVDAHLHPQLPGPERVRDPLGVAPLLGLALLVVAVLLAANGPVHRDEYGSYRDGAAALPFFILAAVLLSVGLHRSVVQLPAGAAWTRAAGWIAMGAGPIWTMMPWVAPIGLVFLVSVLGLAVGARRAGVWPAWSVLLLALTLALPAGLFAATSFLPWYALRVADLNFLVVLGPIAVLWLVVGGIVLRGFPRPAQR